MKFFTRSFYIICFILFAIAVSETSCQKSKGNTEKRIKKQKKRQKRNPGDCPRIDC